MEAQFPIDGIQLFLTTGVNGTGYGDVFAAPAETALYGILSRVRCVAAYYIDYQGLEIAVGQSHRLDGKAAWKGQYAKAFVDMVLHRF